MVSFRISCLPREHFSTENQSKNCPNQAEVRRTDRVSALDPQRSRSTPTERNKRHQWKSVKLMSNASTKDISECLHKRAFTNPIYESSAHYSTLSIESTSSMATDSSSSLVLQTNLHAALVPLDVKSPTSTPRQMQAEEALRITRGHHRQSSDPGKDSIQRQEQPTELSPQSIWNDSNQSTLGCSECFGNLSSSINSSDSNGNEDDDDDNGKAMILEDWHRASLWNVDWSNVFSTHTELWRASQLFDHLIAVRHNPVQNGNEHTRSVPIGFGHNWTDTDADAEVDADTDADAEVDADTDAETENKKIKPIVDANTLEIKGLSLEEALQSLCDNIGNKEVNRVLEKFAYRYWSENNTKVYGSADDVYEIMRSFLCLAEGSDGQTKMTSIIDFCGHAIERIKSCVPESTAEWKSKVQDHLTSIYRIAEHGGAYFTNDNSTTVIKEAQTSNVVVPAVTVVPAVSIKALPLVQPTSTPPSVRRSQIRKGSVSLLSSTPSPSPSAGPRRSSSWTKLRRIDTCCDKKGPYHKGTLSFQQLAPRKKAEEQESWKSCWAVLEHGQLVLFHSRESVGSKVPLLTVPTQNESESHFKTELFLGHSMAQESNRRNTFVLQLANNVAYLFDCGSEDQVRVWVDHCNMWAAIESKIKLASVTTCLDWDPMSALMQLWHWRPTPLSAGTSMLNREDQVKTIQIYLDDLQKDQRWHASLYDLIIKLPADTPHYADLYKNWHYKCWHTSRTMERYHIYENILILAISRSNLI